MLSSSHPLTLTPSVISTHSMSPYFASVGWSDFTSKSMSLKLMIGHSHLFTLEPEAVPIVLQYFQKTLVPGSKPTAVPQPQLQLLESKATATTTVPLLKISEEHNESDAAQIS